MFNKDHVGLMCKIHSQHFLRLTYLFKNMCERMHKKEDTLIQ